MVSHICILTLQPEGMKTECSTVAAAAADTLVSNDASEEERIAH